MGHRIRVLVAGVASALVVAGSAAGPAIAQDVDPVPVSAILEESDFFAGATVTVQGELVGDYGTRRDGTMWTQLNDDSYAYAPLVDGGARTGSNIGIGVHFQADQVAGLDPPGGYRLRGPIVSLTGEWRHHDPERGGESYLEVHSVVVVKSGKRLAEGPDWLVMVAGIVLIGAAAGLFARRRFGS